MTIKVNADKAIYKSSPWEETTLRINGVVVKWGDPVFIDRARENTLEVEAPQGFAKELRLGLGNAGNLTFKAFPDFGTPVQEPFEWKITPDDSSKSGLVELVLYSADVEEPWPLECYVMSENLADEVEEFLVNGEPYEPDYNWGFRNESTTITLAYKPDSPLAKYPLLQLLGVPLTGMNDGNLTVTPTGSHTWSVVADTSGTYKLELMGTGFSNGIESPVSRVVSRELKDEVTVQINGKDAEPGAIYYRGEECTLTLVYKPGSPLEGYRIGLWTGRSPLVTCVPAPESFTRVHSWKITFASDRSGVFHFELAAEHFGRGNIKIEGNKLLSTKLEDEATVLLGGVAIPSNGADFAGGEPHTLTLSYKNGDVLKGVSLALDWIPGSGLSYGDMTSQPSLRQFTSDHQWKVTLTAFTTGTFGLKLYTEGERGVWTSPNNRLSKPNYSSVTMYFVQILDSPAPLPPETFRIPRFATFSPSVQVSFLPFPKVIPVPGVSVEMVIPEKNNFTAPTNANGKCVAPLMFYNTVGTREITATVTLPDNTKRTAKVLIEVYKQEGETE